MSKNRESEAVCKERYRRASHTAWMARGLSGLLVLISVAGGVIGGRAWLIPSFLIACGLTLVILLLVGIRQKNRRERK
jgi:hypothetical protein